MRTERDVYERELLEQRGAAQQRLEALEAALRSEVAYCREFEKDWRWHPDLRYQRAAFADRLEALLEEEPDASE